MQGIDGVDFVLALRHAFNDGLCLGWHRKIWKKEKVYQDIMNQQGVHEAQGTIFRHLRMSFRCTEELLKLAYYILIHASLEEKLYKSKSFYHLPHALPGKKPLWLKIESFGAFQFFANTELKDEIDVMVIYDGDHEPEVIKKMVDFCDEKNWKSCPYTEVMGSEASIIIIYEMKSIHFEAISRAIHQLVFVSSKDSQ